MHCSTSLCTRELNAIRKQKKMRYLQTFLWKGVSLGYVGENYNLKDLKSFLRKGVSLGHVEGIQNLKDLKDQSTQKVLKGPF